MPRRRLVLGEQLLCSDTGHAERELRRSGCAAGAGYLWLTPAPGEVCFAGVWCSRRKQSRLQAECGMPTRRPSPSANPPPWSQSAPPAASACSPARCGREPAQHSRRLQEGCAVYVSGCWCLGSLGRHIGRQRSAARHAAHAALGIIPSPGASTQNEPHLVCGGVQRHSHHRSALRRKLLHLGHQTHGGNSDLKGEGRLTYSSGYSLNAAAAGA